MYTVVPGLDTFVARTPSGVQIDIGDYLELTVDKIKIDGWHECTMTLSSHQYPFKFRAKLDGVRNKSKYRWICADGKTRLNEIKQAKK